MKVSHLIFIAVAALSWAGVANCGEEPAPAAETQPVPPPAPAPERPKVRYWLDDTGTAPRPAAARQTVVVPREDDAEKAEIVPDRQLVGNEPLVVDERSMATRDACGRGAELDAEINCKLQEAKLNFKRGDYQCTVNIARDILRADPRNVEAAEWLRKAQGKQLDADERVTKVAGERRDREALLEAEEHAVRPPARMSTVRPHLARRGEGEETQRRQKMSEKLDERVTLDFLKADLEWVLNTLFIMTGVNIVADQAALEGKSLTLHVEDLPLREVLNFIVRNNEGIQFAVTEDAVWITATSGTEQQRLMYPKIYPLHHGLVSTAAGGGMSGGGRTGGGGGGTGGGGRPGARAGTNPSQTQGSMEASYIETVLKWMKDSTTLPDKSEYLVDRQSNQIVVFTTPAGHEAVGRFLDAFDQPPIQVLIKTRFLDISAEGEKELGINLDYLRTRINIGESGVPGAPADDVVGTVRDPLRAVDWLGGITPTLATPGSTFTLTGRRTDPLFQASLKALLTNRHTRILSEPQVLALNNKDAYIEIDTEFSYITDLRPVTTTQLGGTGTAVQNVSAFVPEFEKERIGFYLAVTPSVGRDLKTINLHLNPWVDTLHSGQQISQFQTFDVTQASNTTTPPTIQRPTIDQTTLETDVVLEDNGYVIIGGLIRHREETQERKIPGLHRIPYLGNLFKTKSTTKQRSNLMIIVEAQIITPGGRTYHKDVECDDVDVREGGVPRAPGQVSGVHRPYAVDSALGLATRKPTTIGPEQRRPQGSEPRQPGKLSVSSRSALAQEAVHAPVILPGKGENARERMERLAKARRPSPAQMAARAGWGLPEEEGATAGVIAAEDTNNEQK